MTKQIKIIGIDLGTVKSAVTHMECDSYLKGDLKFVSHSVLITTDVKERDQRIVTLIKKIWRSVREYDPDLIVVEYPFGIMGNGKIVLEMFGMLRYLITEYQMHGSSMKFLELSQTRIKKYVIGSGKAEKSDMRMQVMKEYGLDLSEDCADSFWIAHMGMSYILPPEKAYRKESIAKWKQSMEIKPKKAKKAKK